MKDAMVPFNLQFTSLSLFALSRHASLGRVSLREEDCVTTLNNGSDGNPVLQESRPVPFLLGNI